MFINFARHFLRAVWHVKAVILMLVALMVTVAAAVPFIEQMPFSGTLYFTFVMGLTIGLVI